MKIHKVQNAVISETAATSLIITWEKPKGPVTGYLVTCQTTAAAATPRDKKSSKDNKKKKEKKRKDDEEKTKEDEDTQEEKKEEEEEEDKEREMKIEDPDAMRVIFEGLKPEEEYVIKIYTMVGEKKSDRVKVPGKTGK